MKRFLATHKLFVALLAVLVVLTILLCIPVTLHVFVGVFGYAAYFYLVLGYAVLILRYKKVKLPVPTKRLVLYAVTTALLLLTLHVGIIGKEVVESGFGGYIGSTYEQGTVGGVVLSVVSSPIVLLCKYIASVVIFFVLTAAGGFLCIVPFLFDNPKKKKPVQEKEREKKEETSFVPPVIDENPVLTDEEPPLPVEPERPLDSRERARQILFGTDLPEKKPTVRQVPVSEPKRPKTLEEQKAELFGNDSNDNYRIFDEVYAPVIPPDDSVYTTNYMENQRRKEARSKLYTPPSEEAKVDLRGNSTVRDEVEDGIRYNPYVPSQPIFDSDKQKSVEPQPAQPEPYVLTYEKPDEVAVDEPGNAPGDVTPEEKPIPFPTVYPILPEEEEPEEMPEEEEEPEEDVLPTVQDSEYLRALNAQAGTDAPLPLDYEEEPAIEPIEEKEPEPTPPPQPVEPEKKPEPPKKKRSRKKYNRYPEEKLIDRPLPPGFLPYVENLGQLKDVIENQAKSLGLSMTLIDAIKGPTVTYCTVQLGEGCQVKKVQSAEADLALKFHAVSDIKIIPQIPGTPYVGIEIPNTILGSVSLKEVLTSEEYKNAPGELVVALGRYSRGEIMVSDLASWPHALVAGSSGSGKSVCLNAILTSLVYRYSPFDLQLVLIDKKKVEMIDYAGLPHMMFKDPLTEDDEICKAIVWLQKETDRRFDVLKEVKAKNLATFNSKMPESEQLPRIVIVIDEASELMTKPLLRKTVEPALSSISRIGRACGVHMIFATQTPTRDVITSEIQNNFNTKIAFHVNEFRHSMVILGNTGAEKLRGHGDMLYMSSSGDLFRGQGLYVSDHEIEDIVEYIIQNNEPDYDEEFIKSILASDPVEPETTGFSDAPVSSPKGGFAEKTPDLDMNFVKQVLKIFVDSNRVSATYIQRKFNRGYNTIANVMDYLEDNGYVSPQSGNKRNLLITKEEFYARFPEMRDEIDDGE